MSVEEFNFLTSKNIEKDKRRCRHSRQIAKICNIRPNATLHADVSHVTKKSLRPMGRPRYFTPEEEYAIVDIVRSSTSLGIYTEKRAVLLAARRFILDRRQKWRIEGKSESLANERKFPDDQPGYWWMRSFVDRHPELKLKEAKIIPDQEMAKKGGPRTYSESVRMEKEENRNAPGRKLADQQEPKPGKLYVQSQLFSPQFCRNCAGLHSMSAITPS